MSSTRADVLRALALHDLEPRHRAWLDEQQHTVDAEEHQVLCVFAPDESAHAVLGELRGYAQPVIVCTLLGDDLAMMTLDPRSTPAPSEQGTIAELVHAHLS